MSDENDGVPLEAEPPVVFHPSLAGLTSPGRLQPAAGSLKLEEEPATWVQLARDAPAEPAD